MGVVHKGMPKRGTVVVTKGAAPQGKVSDWDREKNAEIFGKEASI